MALPGTPRTADFRFMQPKPHHAKGTCGEDRRFCFPVEPHCQRRNKDGQQAEIKKIKNVFLAILRDIKKDIDNKEQPGEAVTAAMFQKLAKKMIEQVRK